MRERGRSWLWGARESRLMGIAAYRDPTFQPSAYQSILLFFSRGKVADTMCQFSQASYETPYRMKTKSAERCISLAAHGKKHQLTMTLVAGVDFATLPWTEEP